MKDIDLGAADGEKESHNEHFVDLFYKKNKSYQKIIDDPYTFIISGRKGTGKTILAKYIEAVLPKRNNSICKVINSSNINLEIMKQKGYETLNETEQQTFFKWYFLNEIAKIILRSDIKARNIIGTSKSQKYWKLFKVKRQIKCLEKFFEEYYDTNSMFKRSNRNESNSLTEETHITLAQMQKILGMVLNNTTPNTPEVGISGKDVSSYSEQNTSVKKKYFDVIEELSDIVCNICIYINVVILFDNFDELSEKILPDSKITISFIRMINAAKELNTLLAKTHIKEDKIYNKIILCMRTDMLKVLNKESSNLNKYLIDGEVELYWGGQVEKPWEHALMALILNKIRKSVKELANMSNEKIYTRFFYEPVDGGKSVIQYLLNYSFERPRDIITFLNIIKKNNPEATYFSATMFKNAFPTYADKFLGELQNELSLYYKREEIDNYFELITHFAQTHKKVAFRYEDLETYLKDKESQYPYIQSLDEFLETMYKFGVIGNTWGQKKQEKNARSRYLYSFAYKYNGLAKPNKEIRFTIHHVVRKALSV